MQNYTKKMLFDISLARYKEAENKLSDVATISLISCGNSCAYNRKKQESYTAAIVNIVNDIFECEKKALSCLTAFPTARYFSMLKKEVWDIANRQIHGLNERHKITINDGLIREKINRAADQLKEEVRLQLPTKVVKILKIASLPIILSFISYLRGWVNIAIDYLSGWVRSFICIYLK